MMEPLQTFTRNRLMVRATANYVTTCMVLRDTVTGAMRVQQRQPPPHPPFAEYRSKVAHACEPSTAAAWSAIQP